MNVKNKSLLPKCKIIIVKIMNSEEIRECGPCEMCNKLIKKYGIKHKKKNFK